MSALLEKLARVPGDPGVYQMRDETGAIIYVGKARNLKKRLSTYLVRPDQPDMKTHVLVSRIADFSYIVTGSEHEALILESNLIKTHKPRYNVILKDDKQYPCLRLDVKNPYPTLKKVRRIKNDGAVYFGPYSSGAAVNQTLKWIHRNFPLRKCGDTAFSRRNRPCLQYQIKACLGPCCLPVDPAVYQQVVTEVTLFLKGKTRELLSQVRDAMHRAAEAQAFEEAALLRDRLFALERMLERQVVVSADLGDRDVIGMARESGLLVITLMTIREGRLQDTRHFRFDTAWPDAGDVMGGFLRQYYADDRMVPAEVLVAAMPEDADFIASWLTGKRGRRVHLRWPRRGEKRRILEMAETNALTELKDITARQEHRVDLLKRLAKRLGLADFPHRIECIDNSNLQGQEPVSGVVVFSGGQPDTAEYRKYRIRNVPEQNDYAYMAEVLKRRYRKAAETGAYPDLLMVDGGKGQLNIACAILRELGIEGAFPVIGIAKPDETRGESADKIFLPGRMNPVIWGKDADALNLLARIRDEAHRFAIRFHRQRRNKRGLTSVLDAVPGIGKKRKTVLLMHFGSLENAVQASVDEVAALPGWNLSVAAALKSALAGVEKKHRIVQPED
ncbi:MAG: excinuclease ABC subunit C [Deltaproteobacteria bacterium]|nr:MAG: excinuclease ABC subunit C [Deltaproteobacteria bacterium]